MQYNIKKILNENIEDCTKGIYRNIQPTIEKIKYEEHKIVVTNDICDVNIYCDEDVISLCEKYLKNDIEPIIAIILPHNFNEDSNIGEIQDIKLLLRTNICTSIDDNYPLDEDELAYTKDISVIREEDMSKKSINNIYNISLMTVSSISKPRIIKLDDDDVMIIDDYKKMRDKIENIFYIAYKMNHDVLILTNVSCRGENIPINDITDIFNICILKYGSKFNEIVFNMPINNERDLAIYHYFNNNIIKPQNIQD